VKKLLIKFDKLETITFTLKAKPIAPPQFYILFKTLFEAIQKLDFRGIML
jgi:hypothetical protein